MNKTELKPKLLERFEEITGVKPKSGRMGVGSMKEFIRIAVPYSKDSENFTDRENYHSEGGHVFKGVKVTFIGNAWEKSWHQRKGYELEIKISELLN